MKSSNDVCIVHAPALPQIPPTSELFLPIATFFYNHDILPIVTFKKYSTKTGYLNQQEFDALLCGIGCHLPSQQIRWTFQAALNKHKDEISKVEFLNIVKIPDDHLPTNKNLWRKCSVLPGYCTEHQRIPRSDAHQFCGYDTVKYTSLKLPELVSGMTHGKIIKWLKVSGDIIKKGDIICQIQLIDIKDDITCHFIMNRLNITHKDKIEIEKDGNERKTVQRVITDNMPLEITDKITEYRYKTNTSPILDLYAKENGFFCKSLIPINHDIDVGTYIALITSNDDPNEESDDKNNDEKMIKNVDNDLICDKKSYFSKDARESVYNRRNQQKEFMNDVIDETKVLPTKAIGLFHHMGDMTLPKPMIFIQQDNTTTRNNNNNNTTQQQQYKKDKFNHKNNYDKQSIKNSLDGRTIPEFIRALDGAKNMIEGDGKYDKVSDIRMSKLLRSSLISDSNPLVQEIGNEIPKIKNQHISKKQIFSNTNKSFNNSTSYSIGTQKEEEGGNYHDNGEKSRNHLESVFDQNKMITSSQSKPQTIKYDEMKIKVLSHPNVMKLMKQQENYKSSLNNKDEEPEKPKPLYGNAKPWR